MRSREAENKARVERFFAALNAGDAPAIADSYAADGRVWTSGQTLISGTFDKAQIQAASGGIFAAFPQGLRFTVNGMVAEGEKVAVEAESRGLHASGRIYTNQYHFLFEFRDGMLVMLKEYMDTERVTDVLCGGQRPAPPQPACDGV
jgi:hypothetical protein